MDYRKYSDSLPFWKMHKEEGLPELLAPAGSLEHLKAAVKAGADAIYMGGQRFGARAYADNLDQDNLTEALHYAHLHGRRLYLTVNTLMKEDELNHMLYGFLEPYYEAGLDGVIVQDLGTASFIRRHFPEMEIHASTQMTITHPAGASAAKRMGMQRIVPARELSLEEIDAIKKETGLEVEVFVHGALCYCYSGQCLLSSMYGGRSGNRGRCAQPCRLPYTFMEQSKYLLSPKDLCALPILPSLIEHGVDSLKIEGRMKNISYVAGVTAIYRKYLDQYAALQKVGETEKWAVEEADSKLLSELYCRDGFTEGYWNQHNGAKMMSVVSPKNLGRKVGEIISVQKRSIRVRLDTDVRLLPKDLLIIPLEGDREIVLTVPANLDSSRTVTLNVPDARGLLPHRNVYRRQSMAVEQWLADDVLKEIKYPVSARMVLKAGENTLLSVKCRDVEVCLKGAPAEVAQKKAIRREDMERQMGKTGAVPFYLDNLIIEMEENLFLPVSVVKDLRQQAYAQLEQLLATKNDRPKPGKKVEEGQVSSRQDISMLSGRIAVVYDRKLLQTCLEDSFFTDICLPMDHWPKEELLSLGEEIHLQGKRVCLSLPPVLRGKKEHWMQIAKEDVWDMIYVHNINQAELLCHEASCRNRLAGSASLYQWNHMASNTIHELFDITVCQLPTELSGKEFSEMAKQVGYVEPEWQVYGRVPLMISAQCIKKTTRQCNGRSETLWMEDQKNRKIPVTTHCEDCYNKLWLDRPRNLIGQEAGSTASSIHRFRFDFFLTSPSEIGKIKQQFLSWEQNHFQRCSGIQPDEHWNYGIQ